MESTEGFTAQSVDPSFPVDMTTMPPLLGYNRAQPREGAKLHAVIDQTGDPLLATMSHGAGTTLAFMSDPAPHWGCNFVQWDRYADFWLAALEQVL